MKKLIAVATLAVSFTTLAGTQCPYLQGNYKCDVIFNTPITESTRNGVTIYSINDRIYKADGSVVAQNRTVEGRRATLERVVTCENEKLVEVKTLSFEDRSTLPEITTVKYSIQAFGDLKIEKKVEKNGNVRSSVTTCERGE